MQWLYHVIGQVGIFLICAQTLIHFRPRESYEKYLKLLLSVMLLIQLLQPLLTVLGGDEIAGTDVQAAEFAEEIGPYWNRRLCRQNRQKMRYRRSQILRRK